MDLTKRIQTIVLEKLASATQPESRMGDQMYQFSADMLKNLYPNSWDYLPRFAFNHYALAELKNIEYAPFRVPCIYGFVEITTQIVGQFNPLTFALISRKDCRRPGRRFIVRGLDRDGNAANFVETEHIFSVLQADTKNLLVASHVQTRGSIPLQWSMKPNLSWSPPVVINPDLQVSVEYARKHIEDTTSQYKT